MHPFVVPCLSSQSLTKGPEFPRSRFARVSLLFALLLYTCALPTLGQKFANASSSSAVTRIQWIPQPGVRRYRLQIASDERFNDVKFDGLVKGREYIPRDRDLSN